ncbi:MAG: C25 family cysteine peptidase [Bacteroidota bacterium]|nr:C25 family cysteine peptidase [Bacteroidota bacterium]MDP3145706.1 C25 family cysteine peptidase [Bacteroidota bacterium]
MRKLLAISIFCFVAFTTKSQTYGNGWINYSQQYFKFPISKEGIYRIDSATLSNYFNLNTLNPKNFQLFIKGKENYLFINGENDNKINIGDYLEFYGSPAMGDVDSLIYTGINYLPNKYAPLFNDTIYGFLTLNNLTTNKRYVLETDTNSIAYPAGNYFYSEKIFSPISNYNTVTEYYSDASDPRYTQAEGRGSAFYKGGSISTAFSNLNTYTTTNLPIYLSINYSGMSVDNTVNKDHQIKTVYTDQNNVSIQLADTTFKGYLPVRQTFTLNSQNTNNSTNITLNSIAASQFSLAANATMLHYINYFHPQNLNLNNQAFYKLFIDNDLSFPKTFFNFSSFNLAASNSVLLYDISNNKRITTKIATPQVRAVIPNGAGRKLCIMAAESQTIAITSLIKVNQTGTFTNFKNSPATNPFVIIYHNSLQSGASSYKNYRQTIAGGSYNVISANIDELYEQFGYGINKHPIAIKNFCNFLKDSLATAPKYIFLIGKGVGCDALSPSTQSLNLIPTMGIPSCDNLLTSVLSPTNLNTFAPEIPIGRIAALSNNDVNIYLTKVQQHESSGPAEWKKRVLHFVGGDEIVLANTLSSFMSNYEQIIKDTLFGAEVFTFKKNTTAPIQIAISDSIKGIISNGAALINFFGHGSEQGFDQAIDDPEQYNNTGKYPFVIANSCYSGNIHIPGRVSVSERFVFSNQKGSIGFLAATSLGFVHALNTYNNWFYQAISKTKYNTGIGDIIKEAAINNAISFDKITQFTSLDMTLHGDPSLIISVGALPDFQLKNSDVIFNTKKYTDSLGIRINMKNLGKAVGDSIFVKVERFFPNGDSSIIFKRIKAPLFIDSIVFFTPIDFVRGVGLNKFKVKLDEFNEVGESIETNNSTIGTVDIFIPGGDIVPVYPYKYAIVPKTNTITLKASTTDPFAPTNTYRFQLDTCDKFTNPIQTTLITSSGGVLEWNVNLPFADSTVYFWRVSRDSTLPTTPFIWRESSFQTIIGKSGWAQAHFHQFKNDNYRFVSYKKNLRKFIFENNKQSIACRNGIQPAIFPTSINFFFNNITLSSWGCAPDGWNFAVFDSISGNPDDVISVNWPLAGPGTYSNCVCVDNQVLHVYSFGASNYCGFGNWKTTMENFLNAVPANNYVLAYTMGAINPNYAEISSYSNNLYNAFESIGAVTIRTTPDTVPYILFGKKGMLAGQGHEVKGTNKQSIITLNDSIKTRWNSGYIASEIIGPSYKWNSLHWRVQSVDLLAGDTTILKLVGIKSNGQIDTLQTFVQDSTDILALYNYADAQVYPYLKMVAFMKDNINTTSPQLKKWQIIYEEAPECAINPLKGFESINDTLQEGDEVTFKFPIENIGVKNFTDSLVVTYWIEDNNRNQTPLPKKMKSKPFIPGQVFIDTVKINSFQLVGNNALWIYVNPLANLKYQKEQTQFNNIGRYSFKVSKDITNPLLDVTFDGVRILNGDIISAKPSILVTLKDENRFLALNDTGSFSLFIQAPNQSTQQRIYFAQGLQFTPANLPKNSCSINYNPNFVVDGKYMLIVQAKDRSKNNSGTQDFKIQFEINNKPTVTNVLNYPNPFSTSTKFVFTLTGSEVPEVFTIQIMTITGKIVREIQRAELGHIHIGRNITDYAWDGKDDFGDKLANGVYLYKIVTKLNGNDIERSANSADKYFVKDFGKMVLMR